MLQWNPSVASLVVGDQSRANTYASCVYALKLGGRTATITGSTTFLNYSGGGTHALHRLADPQLFYRLTPRSTIRAEPSELPRSRRKHVLSSHREDRATIVRAAILCSAVKFALYLN
jgi:hypothetical protein